MRFLWQQIPSTIVSEIFCNTKFDGVILDTEHSPYNYESLFTCIQVIKLKNKICYVRLAHLDKILAKMCLDAGCDGLIFSTVETKEQSDEIINYCRYPHFGGKRGQGLNRENNWGEQKLGNSNPHIIAQIETIEAVKNLDQILKCNFDKFLIGPYDLSASLGCTEKFDHPNYLDSIDKILSKIPVEKLGIHIPKNVEKHIKKYENFNFLALGMDTTLIIEKIEDFYE